MVDPGTFRDVMAQWPSGVTVVTTLADGAWHGMTASSFASVSLDPPLISVCLDKKLYSHQLISTSGVFGINVLAKDQAEVARRFAGMVPGVEDRFAGEEWTTAETGVPLLDSALGWLDCRVLHEYAKERALVGVPDQTFWTVFDDAALSLAVASTEQMIVGCGPDDVRRMANARPGVHMADSLAGLAAVAGIDAAGLAESVARYNDAVAAGEDPDFGRTHLPAPIATGPFYAIRNHAITLVTFQGLDIDDRFRVRDEAGEPIEGLHAVGEVIGAGATCGNSFCSGMLLTPALVFGRILGERLASDRHTHPHGGDAERAG